MIKKGFTLAEVLITLSIIGVVAALTMPALTQNVGGAKVGPTLAKFVNTFENAAQNMMNEEEVGTILANTSDFSSALSTFTKYFPASPYSGDNITLTDSTGNTVDTLSKSNMYVLKDGTLVSFSKTGTLSAACKDQEVGRFKGCTSIATVVINGSKASKHVVGRDVFAFLVDKSGMLIPYGSSAYVAFSATKAQNGTVTSDTSACNRAGNASTSNKNATQDKKSLYACTGAVADNGWKMPN